MIKIDYYQLQSIIHGFGKDYAVGKDPKTNNLIIESPNGCMFLKYKEVLG